MVKFVILVKFDPPYCAFLLVAVRTSKHAKYDETNKILPILLGFSPETAKRKFMR